MTIMSGFAEPERERFLRYLFERVKGEVGRVTEASEIGELVFTGQELQKLLRTKQLVQDLRRDNLVEEPVRDGVCLTRQGYEVAVALYDSDYPTAEEEKTDNPVFDKEVGAGKRQAPETPVFVGEQIPYQAAAATGTVVMEVFPDGV
jgi:hypothetical protein